jgi:hypothetical protein
MGILFNRKSKPNTPDDAVSHPATSSAAFEGAETLFTMLSALFTSGTFIGALDERSLFETHMTPDDLQVARNTIEPIQVVMSERVAGLCVAGIDPGRMVFLIIDPILNKIFGAQTQWRIDTTGEVWTAVIGSGEALSLRLTCKKARPDASVADRFDTASSLAIEVIVAE